MFIKACSSKGGIIIKDDEKGDEKQSVKKPFIAT